MMKDPAIIVDLDGTVADCTHRLHFISDENHKMKESPDWDSFNLNCVDDSPIKSVIKLVTNYKVLGHKIVIVTGRMDDCYQLTADWLDKHLVPWDALYMRAKSDFKSDFVIKKEVYETFIEPKYNVELVLEDRDKVVEMWRDLGLLCLQPRKGDY